MVLQITQQAKERMIELLGYEDNDQLRLRLGIKDESCNGLSYTLGFDQNYDHQYDYLTNINGIPVTIKKADVSVIAGTTIDFKQNMMGGSFTIDNPNIVKSCGCGSENNPSQRQSVSEK